MLPAFIDPPYHELFMLPGQRETMHINMSCLFGRSRQRKYDGGITKDYFAGIIVHACIFYFCENVTYVLIYFYLHEVGIPLFFGMLAGVLRSLIVIVMCNKCTLNSIKIHAFILFQS
jgi:hypothetical protein